jgi:hypothetical protein
MTPTRLLRPFGLLAFAVLSGACESFDVERSQFAIIHVPTLAVEGGFTTKPTAFFFEGQGIGLSTTEIGTEGCVDRAILPAGGGQSFDYIDAGPSIPVDIDGSSATLTPQPDGQSVTYKLIGDQSIPFDPGDVISLAIPGVAGGFPAFLVTARTVEIFTPGPVAIPASTSENLNLTWENEPESSLFPGSAMFYSFKYGTVNATVFDREIACVFADDGSGVVQAADLAGFRASTIRNITAQRARITVDRAGRSVTHVTSTLARPVELLDSDP